MANDVIIHPYNNVYMRLECDDGIHRELREHYTFFVPGAKHHPLVKKRLWDGKKRIYDHKKKLLYTGLHNDLKESLEKLGYTFESRVSHTTDITPEESVEYCNSLNVTSRGENIKHKKHQLLAFYMSMKHKRRVILSPTASGKSLIIYSIIRRLLEETEGKILIIVPLVGLCRQLYNDFIDYSRANGFNVEEYVHQIAEGSSKISKKRIFISTFQSIYKEDIEYFEQFQTVIVDETHKAKSDSFVGILEKCINAEYRLGFTGTLDGCAVNELVIQGLLGKVTRVAETKDLIDKGVLAKLNITFYELKYRKEEIKELDFDDYTQEMEWLISHERRNHFITQLANSLEGNVLILFRYVGKHGKVLDKLLREQSDKNIHFVHGSVDTDDREQIKKIVEDSNDNIINASFGVFSTGENIKNIHHIIFASPYKSIITVLQSIGRGLRVTKDKKECHLHDICDNLVKRSRKNLTLQHGIERLKIYNNQKFDYNITKVDL